jgi:alkylation response protein AidB-like acyl-CoA dehydrogenase
MDFDLSDVQRSWREKAQSLGRELSADATAADVVIGAARAGLLDPQADLVAAALAVEALACESAAAGMALALHTAALLVRLRQGRIALRPDQAALDERTAFAVRSGAAGSDGFESLVRGETVGALSLSTEDVPSLDAGKLTGRASWVGPVTGRGVAIVGARHGDEIIACAVSLDAKGVQVEPVTTSALRGFVSAYVMFAGAPCVEIGAPARIMARARTLIAATALGIGNRALRESLAVAHRERGAGGEQTVEGLLADTATELDAARLLTWKAAGTIGSVSLADASMAKLAAASAAQAAVVRATQVVGVDSFRRGHVIERLTQDVRAIELFAGRTEALREAVADEELPRV